MKKEERYMRTWEEEERGDRREKVETEERSREKLLQWNLVTLGPTKSGCYREVTC